MKLSDNSQGFTLTELLIVLLIIGIPTFIFLIKEVGAPLKGIAAIIFFNREVGEHGDTSPLLYCLLN
jgi:prepilin-type N-terminal cleavage/methylation domain-containing protein